MQEIEAQKREEEEREERQRREEDDIARKREEYNRRYEEMSRHDRKQADRGHFSDADMESIAQQLDAADFSSPTDEATSAYWSAHYAPSREEYNAGWSAFSAANGVPYEPI